MLYEIWFEFSVKELKIRRGCTVRNAEQSCCSTLLAAWMFCLH